MLKVAQLNNRFMLLKKSRYVLSSNCAAKPAGVKKFETSYLKQKKVTSFRPVYDFNLRFELKLELGLEIAGS